MDNHQAMRTSEAISPESAPTVGTTRKRELSPSSQASSSQRSLQRIRYNESQNPYAVSPSRIMERTAGSDNAGEQIGDLQEDTEETFRRGLHCTQTEGDLPGARPPPPARGNPDPPNAPFPTTSTGGARCFRIRAIPLDWNHQKLLHTLYQENPPLREHKHFQLSLCRSGLTQTALLNFKDTCTEYFQSILPYEDCHTPSDLVIDRHFHGMTVLHTPDERTDVDIIAVTGLAGHAFGSWRHKTTHKMWLKDFLPQDLKNARVMTYGYDSRLDGPHASHHRIVNFQRTFLEEIENSRDDVQQNRPIIFAGHSLGGLLILETLLESNKNDMHKHILQSTRGLFFFGTPHDGLRTEELEKTITDLNAKFANNPEEQRWRRDLVDFIRNLSPGSDYLERLRDDVAKMLNGFPEGSIVSFYETVRTNTTCSTDGGRIERGEHQAMLVERFAALLRVPSEQKYAIEADHSSMAKFSSRSVRSYMTIVRCMSRLIFAADVLGQVKDGRIPPSHILSLLSPAPRAACDFDPHDPHHFWVLKNTMFKDWMSSQSLQLLCVSHKDASHIEKIAHHVTDRLEKEGRSVFYFSCVNARPVPVAFAHTLLYELAKASEPDEKLKLTLLQTFLQRLCREETEKSKSSDPRRNLAQFGHQKIKELIDKASDSMLMEAVRLALVEWVKYHTLVAVIDGLDDVDQKDSEFREAVVRLFQSRVAGATPIKTLFTGRSSTFFEKAIRSSELIDYSTLLTDCLKSLNVETSRYRNILPEHKHSFDWLESHPKYLAWSKSRNSCLLLVKGKPGSGKSTLCKYFFNRLPKIVDSGKGEIPDQESPLHTLPSCGSCHRSRPIVASFFYSDRDKETSHVVLLKVLLYQILQQNADFFYHYHEKFSDCKGNWTYDSLIGVLLTLSAHPVKEHIYLLIDAFDESDISNGERAKFVKDLKSLCNERDNTVVKIFLTSRPVNELPDTLNFHTFNLHDHTRSDISRYAYYILEELSVSAEIPPGTAESIVDRADGVFIWVYLVGKFLVQLDQNGCSPNAILEALKVIPSDLKKMYQRILDEICCENSMEPQISDFRHSKRLFRYILFANRPLTISELRHVWAVSEYPELMVHTKTNLDHYMMGISGMVRRIVHCGRNLIGIGGLDQSYESNDPPDEPGNTKSFLRMDNGNEITGIRSVQLMHQTVRDFLLHPSSLTQLGIDETTSHYEITTASFRYLYLFCRSSRDSHPSKKLDSWTTDDIEHFVQFLQQWEWINYILVFLPAHLCKCEPDGQIAELKIMVRNELRASISARNLLANWTKTSTLSLLDRPIERQSMEEDDTVSKELDISQFLNRMLSIAALGGRDQAVEILLTCGADLKSKHEHGRTALHLAASAGHEATVQRLLYRGADIESRDDTGQTALRLAASDGHVLVVRLLLNRSSNADSRDNERRTPLSWAAESGHEKVVQLLLARDDVDADSKDESNQTPLSWAAESGHEEVVQLLLARDDVDADSKGESNATPLSWAADSGHVEVVQLLLARNDVDADSRDESNRTPLSWAAESGHEEVVQLLLARNDVDADSKDRYNRTPLSWAAGSGQMEVVQLLLARNDVDADSKDTSTRTPLSWAAQGGYEEVVRLILARNDVDADSKDESNQTPLSWAAGSGHEEVVQLLLASNDVDADPKDQSNRTPLSWAAQRGHVEVVQLLLARNDVDADSKDQFNRTPLFGAAQSGHEEVVKLLLARNDVDADSKDESNQTPLSWAAESGHEEVVQLLLARNDVVADSKDRYNRTPLSWAAENGHEGVVWLLLARDDVDADSKDQSNRTPLSWAAENGHVEVVQLLLARNDVDADSKDESNGTPLSWAAGNGWKKVVQLLLARDDVDTNSMN